MRCAQLVDDALIDRILVKPVCRKQAQGIAIRMAVVGEQHVAP